MTPILTNKEIKESARLVNVLDAGQNIPVKDIRNFLAGIQRKGESFAGPAKRTVKKPARKDHYRSKLKIA